MAATISSDFESVEDAKTDKIVSGASRRAAARDVGNTRQARHASVLPADLTACLRICDFKFDDGAPPPYASWLI